MSSRVCVYVHRICVCRVRRVCVSLAPRADHSRACPSHVTCTCTCSHVHTSTWTWTWTCPRTCTFGCACACDMCRTLAATTCRLHGPRQGVRDRGNASLVAPGRLVVRLVVVYTYVSSRMHTARCHQDVIGVLRSYCGTESRLQVR